MGDIAERSYEIAGVRFPAPAIEPGLHVVATPIGNLADVTLRAIRVLTAADLLACEDTRVTGVLLNRYGIARSLTTYHEHNAIAQRPRLLAALAEGKSVALASDAGTPLLSDPGYRLVAEAAAAGYPVFPVPGASALLAALVVAGLPTDSFFFAGFLPPKQTGRRKRLAALAAIPATLVFYESPHRLAASLTDMAAVLGDRPSAVARELTKAFETVRRGTLSALANEFAGAPPKGEIVVVVGPPGESVPEAEDIDALLVRLLADASVREAAAQAAALTGLPRRDLYRRALSLKDKGDGTSGRG